MAVTSIGTTHIKQKLEKAPGDLVSYSTLKTQPLQSLVNQQLDLSPHLFNLINTNLFLIIFGSTTIPESSSLTEEENVCEDRSLITSLLLWHVLLKGMASAVFYSESYSLVFFHISGPVIKGKTWPNKKQRLRRDCTVRIQSEGFPRAPPTGNSRGISWRGGKKSWQGCMQGSVYWLVSILTALRCIVNPGQASALRLSYTHPSLV